VPLETNESRTGNDLVTIENPIEYRDWDRKVLGSHEYSIFHSSAWAKVLTDAYGYQSRYFCIENGSRFAAMIPIMEISSPLTGKRGVSLPFTDHCSPIIDGADRSRQMWQEVVRHGKDNAWKYIEFHGGKNLFAGHVPAASFFKHDIFISEDVEEIFSKLHGSRRRNIKKADRAGVQVQIDNSPDAMRIFYGLHCKTRERHKIPPQPFHFFENIYSHIIARGQGNIITAVHEDKSIGAAVFFHYGTKALYKFGASDLDHQHLRMNDLIIWKAIEWYASAAPHRFETLSLGRTAKDNEGLRRFKNSWGAEESNVHYYEYSLTNDRFEKSSPNITGLSRKILPRLPSFLVRKIGSWMYRHIG